MAIPTTWSELFQTPVAPSVARMDQDARRSATASIILQGLHNAGWLTPTKVRVSGEVGKHSRLIQRSNLFFVKGSGQTKLVGDEVHLVATYTIDPSEVF